VIKFLFYFRAMIIRIAIINKLQAHQPKFKC